MAICTSPVIKLLSAPELARVRQCGDISCCKATALLQVANNCGERGMAVLLFTAAHDNRAGAGQIGSRLGLVRPAATFGTDTEFNRARMQSQAGGPVACVLVDETQFLTVAQVRQLHRMAHVEDVPVICWGLRSDFQGEALAGSAMLATLADGVEEMKSICACARKATMNIRIDAEGRRVKQGEQLV